MSVPDRDLRPPRRLRIYASLRTAHLERFAQLAPADVLYHRTRYDYDAGLADPVRPPRQVSRFGALRVLARTHYDIVELNEPIMTRRWPDLAAQLAVLRVRAALTRRPTTVVAYGIGYTDPAAEIAARWRLPRPVARRLTRAGLAALVSGFDRLAFGTAGSQDLYARYAGRRRVLARARLFEALPGPCALCPPVMSDPPDARDGRIGSLLFVGAFDDRKGIRPLMAAWEVLRERGTGARLNLLGQGRYADEVAAWAAGHDDVELHLEPSRELIHRSLRASAALVLLSQRVGDWREQVGLPIVEALGHGCEVVTTSETGLARWLAEHGHRVLDPKAPAEAVADALAAAVTAPRPAAEVLAQLPAQDQRLAADNWLMNAEPGTADDPAALVVFPPNRGVANWQRRNNESPVPGAWPYGLEQLRAAGVAAETVEAPELRGVGKRLARYTGVRIRRTSAAGAGVTALSWDETTAVRMAAGVRAARYLSGVIWATDQIVAGRDDDNLRLQRDVLSRLDGLWALSRPQTAIIADWLGAGCPPVHYLQFGVDVDFYRPGPYPVDGPPLVVSVGGDRDRDPATLFAALALVRSARADVTCVVQSRSELPVPDGVTKIEHLPHAQVRDLLARASVTALATRENWHASGMTVALESQSCGRPVVACATPGMDDYVDDGRTGRLVAPGDPEAMAAAILDVLADRDRAAAMGVAARQRVVEGFSTLTMCRQLAGLISASG